MRRAFGSQLPPASGKPADLSKGINLVYQSVDIPMGANQAYESVDPRCQGEEVLYEVPAV